MTSIGSYAFYNCEKLKEINIPEKVKTVQKATFKGCSSLLNLTIAEGVTSIEDSAFEGCSFLPIIKLPNSMTSIGSYAFNQCSDLVAVCIPSGVKYIGPFALNSTDELTVYGKNGSNAQSYAEQKNIKFVSCSSFAVEGNWLYMISGGKATLLHVVGNASGDVVIPRTLGKYSVTTIENYAFTNFLGLTGITIPSTVKTIKHDALSYCLRLNSINVEKNNTVYTAAGNCLIEKKTKKLIKGSNGSVIPQDGSVTSIAESAFDNCHQLTEITVPKGVTSIESYTFFACDSLISVTLPDGLVTIGDGAFTGCSSLTRINIPSSVTSIGEYAFSDCSDLKTIFGEKGTYAQKYAEVHGFGFVDISDNPDFVYGDADGSGEVDITDAMLVFYHVAKKELLPAEALVRCNTNDDNDVDIADAMAIFYFVAKKTDSVRQ